MIKESHHYDEWRRHFQFGLRLSTLREARGISARRMSKDLAMNVNYINQLENSSHFPSQERFLDICQYLDVTPAEFFQLGTYAPTDSDPFLTLYHQLTPSQAHLVYNMCRELINGNSSHQYSPK